MAANQASVFDKLAVEDEGPEHTVGCSHSRLLAAEEEADATHSSAALKHGTSAQTVKL